MSSVNAIPITDREWSGLFQVVADAHRATAVTERFWEAVLDSVPANVAVLNRDGLIVAVNGPWRDFGAENGARGEIGAGVDYLAACDRAAGCGEASAAEAARLLRRTLAGEVAGGSLSYACDSPTVRRRFTMRVVPHLVEARLEGAVVLHFDVTDLAAANDQLHVQARLLNQVDAAVVALDGSRTVRYWSDGAERLYGWASEEVEGRVIDELMEPYPGAWDKQLEELLASGSTEGVVEVKRKDGSVVPVQMRNTLIRAEDGAVEALLGVSTDAQQRVRDEQALRSARDYLRAVTESMPEGLFTLDRDGMLIELNAEAERLLGWRLEDLQGRRMHDVVHGCSPGEELVRYEQCPITRARSEQRTIEVDEDVFVRRDGSLADVAYKASPFETPDGFNGTVVVFRDITEERAERLRQERELLELSWAARIRDALDHDRFELYAQPIVEIASRRTVQHELLLRMNWDGRVVPPGEFLPAAERHGLMEDIDRWVVRRAVELSKLGRSVELNLSAQSLGRPHFHDFIETAFAAAGVDPALLAIEVTETSLAENEEMAAKLLKRLALLGCEIALDDFGTGYGGFSYLKRLPVDFLKIDREFVTDLPSDRSNQAVVSAVVNLARAFGQKTVAEGVEDEETLHLLAVMGVEYAQGYLLGSPQPAEAVLIA